MAFEQVFQRIKVKDLVKTESLETTDVTSDLMFVGVESVSGSGSSLDLSAAKTVSLLSTVGGTGAGALEDGTTGQVKVIKMVADGGDYVLTPDNLAGGTTITFSAVGQVAELVFDGTDWQVTALLDATGMSLVKGTGPALA